MSNMLKRKRVSKHDIYVLPARSLQVQLDGAYVTVTNTSNKPCYIRAKSPHELSVWRKARRYAKRK